jgi:hypothetical protein
MTEQKESYKNFIEDLAKIWLDMIIVYSQDGIKLEEDVTDELTGETTTELVDVPQTALQEIQAVVKVDVTPKGTFDKFAQESSIENMYVQGMFNVQRLPELKTYVKLLDDDSVMPKQKLEEAIEIIEEEQEKIAMIQAQAQMMQQRAKAFIDSDPEAQAGKMAEAAQQPMVEEAPVVE